MKISNHFPERTCMGCGLKSDKKNFIRLVYDRLSDEIVIDIKHKINARAVYICANKGCYAKMIKRKTLTRFLKSGNLSADAKLSLERIK